MPGLSDDYAMGLFRSSPSADAATARAIPRDVESLEKLIIDLGSASDEASAWRITVDSTVESHSFSYGAVWLPDGNGNVAIGYEKGAIVREMQTVVAGRPVPVDAGLVGRAFRIRWTRCRPG
jgi:hypothetical protein